MTIRQEKPFLPSDLSSLKKIKNKNELDLQTNSIQTQISDRAQHNWKRVNNVIFKYKDQNNYKTDLQLNDFLMIDNNNSCTTPISSDTNLKKEEECNSTLSLILPKLSSPVPLKKSSNIKIDSPIQYFLSKQSSSIIGVTPPIQSHLKTIKINDNNIPRHSSWDVAINSIGIKSHKQSII